MRPKGEKRKAGDLFRYSNVVQPPTMGRLVPVLHDILHHQHADGVREIRCVTPQTRVIILLVASGKTRFEYSICKIGDGRVDIFGLTQESMM